MLNPDKIKTETEIRLAVAEARVAELENLTDRLAQNVNTLTGERSKMLHLIHSLARALQGLRLKRAVIRFAPARDFWREDADYSARKMEG